MRTYYTFTAAAVLALGLTGCISEGDLAELSSAPTPAAATAPSETDKAAAALPAEVTGRTMKQVRFGDEKARFAENAPGIWTEYNEDGAPFNTFTETGRDDWSVYLLDDSRGIRLQLDKHRNMILLGQRGGEMMDQWPMTDASVSADE